jgi:general secretion pathway protein G
MRRRRGTESTIFFPWEARRPRLAWLSRRHARLALAGLGAALVAWALLEVEGYRRSVHATRATIANVMRAVEAFRADHQGRCPAGVVQLLNPDDGREPYLPRTPRDGWGHPLRVVCPGRKHPASADVTSPGPSGSFEARDQVE